MGVNHMARNRDVSVSDQRMRRHLLFNLIKIDELEVSDVHTKQSEPEKVVDDFEWHHHNL